MGHTHEKPIWKLPAGLAAGLANQSLLSSTILMACVVFGGVWEALRVMEL